MHFLASHGACGYYPSLLDLLDAMNERFREQIDVEGGVADAVNASMMTKKRMRGNELDHGMTDGFLLPSRQDPTESVPNHSSA